MLIGVNVLNKSELCRTHEVVPGMQSCRPVSCALATSGHCQVILGGTVGLSLPCATVATYADRLNAACSTSSKATGGVYYPDGVVYYPGLVELLQYQPPNVYIALSQITTI